MTIDLGTRSCGACRAQIAAGASFCTSCGTAVRPSGCASCGQPLPADGSFCPGCGARVAMAERPRTVAGYAGFGRRLLATAIDLLVVGAIFIVADVFWFVADGRATTGRADATLTLEVMGTLLVAVTAYEAGMEASGMQATLGKLALGLRVTREDGGRITVGRAIGRVCARLLTVITVFLGYLTIPLTDHRTALHDIVTGTVVRGVRG